MSRIQAYLRVILPVVLDFDDAANGIETAWQRIFLCLRAGFHDEALEVTESTPLTYAVP